MKYGMRLLVTSAMLGAMPAMLAAQRGAGGPPARRNQVELPPQGGGGRAERIGQVLKTQLQLTDAQATKLQEINRRFGDRRFALNQEEMQSRMTMRDALCGGDTTRSGDIAKSLDQVIDIEKRRVQMLEDEQHELAGFLTPAQRARYMGIAEQIGAQLGGRGGRGGRQGQPNGPPNGPPNGAGPDGPPNGPPQGRAGRGDICANPVPPNGVAPGRRGRGGDGQPSWF